MRENAPRQSSWLSTAGARRKCWWSARANCWRVRCQSLLAGRPRAKPAGLPKLSLARQRYGGIMSRATARPVPGEPMPAVGSFSPPDGALSSAAHLVDVFMVPTTCSARIARVWTSFRSTAAQLEDVARRARHYHGAVLPAGANSAHGVACSGAPAVARVCSATVHPPPSVRCSAEFPRFEVCVRVDLRCSGHGFS